MVDRRIYTSHYKGLRRIPGTVRRVAISRGIPRWVSRELLVIEQRLAPTRAMLSLDRGDYDAAFHQLLAALDPRDVWESLPRTAVLLCWEAPNVWCHRRLVAEWLERGLGVTVPEWGLPRTDSIPYRQLPARAKGESRPTQGRLF